MAASLHNYSLATRTLTPLAATAALGAVALTAVDAQARPRIQRRGGQWGVMMGGSVCVPGKAECTRDGVTEGGVTVDGRTRPSVGLGAELGYRLNPWAFVGASYNLGFFATDYEVQNRSSYKRAYQNSIYGVFRPTLPVWRFDFGLGLGPGFSRQVFVTQNGDRDYSQGFSFKLEPTIDVFIMRRVFLGAKMDLLLNAHRKTCREAGNSTTCVDTGMRDVAPVHQMLFGLHVGATFL